MPNGEQSLRETPEPRLDSESIEQRVQTLTKLAHTIGDAMCDAADFELSNTPAALALFQRQAHIMDKFAQLGEMSRNIFAVMIFNADTPQGKATIQAFEQQLTACEQEMTTLSRDYATLIARRSSISATWH